MNPWYREYLDVSFRQNRRANVEVLDLICVAGSSISWFWPNFLDKNEGFLTWHETTDLIQREMHFSHPGSDSEPFNPNDWRHKPTNSHPSKEPQ